MKTALVLGGHGFIGHHMARKLKKEGYWVRTVDIKEFPYGNLIDDVDDYVIGDLRDIDVCKSVFRGISGRPFDEVYQFSAWMGGVGVIMTGNHDAQILHDSLLLNVNVVEMSMRTGIGKLFFSSSACVYNQLNQENTEDPITAEDSVYPAFPDSEYGFEKIIAEKLYLAYHRNHNLNIRIARFHNITGPEGAWGNGKEKSVSAICRKVAETPDGGEIEIFGDGKQTRSYLYVDECLKGVQKLMASDFMGPVNIGSAEMVSINQLVEMIKTFAAKPNITIKHVQGPLGVRGRRSDNKLIREKLNWEPDFPLENTIKITYPWVLKQVESGIKDCPWAN